MAILATNQDGTYKTKCALCGNPLTQPIFATSHFIADQSNDLWRFSDAAMHWDCYQHWPHQARFAAMYFDAHIKISEDARQRQYWPVLWKSNHVLVLYGLWPAEVSVVLKKSGTDIRVPRSEWRTWVEGGWRDKCLPGLESEALAEVVSELRKVILPELEAGAPSSSRQ